MCNILRNGFIKNSYSCFCVPIIWFWHISLASVHFHQSFHTNPPLLLPMPFSTFKNILLIWYVKYTIVRRRLLTMLPSTFALNGIIRHSTFIHTLHVPILRPHSTHIVHIPHSVYTHILLRDLIWNLIAIRVSTM